MNGRTPALAVEALGVAANGRRLLDRIELSVAPGEVLAIVGPNGAGKTTLLDAILGVRPHEGRVLLAGAECRGFAARARSFAYLPDHATLPPEPPIATLLAEVPASSELAPLGACDLAEASAGALSRGERQRVALHLTLALGRPVVLLDEPFGTFDALRLRTVIDVIRRVARAGTAVVATVHQLGDAEKLADRVLLLHRGRTLASGTVAELCATSGATRLEDAVVERLERAGDAP